MKMNSRPLILLELNEINFDVIKKYIQSGIKLPAFEKLFDDGLITTFAEQRYEELEPWIQWPSVHTGKPYSDHKVFRLGDMTDCEAPQIYELLEQFGCKVGAVSPMNVVNRLRAPAYFIPDPWTDTPSDGGFIIRSFSSALSQAVNDNSQAKITSKSKLALLAAFVRYVPIAKYWFFIKYAKASMGKQWKKALFLDLLIHQVHLTLFKSRAPGFSSVFMNAGAHIQHHYFLNSSQVAKGDSEKNPDWYLPKDADPIFEMLIAYDHIIQDLQSLDVELLVATGLSQQPYVDSKFYYRLKEHGSFLKKLGLVFDRVQPRMTRDFLIQFASDSLALEAAEVLGNLKTRDGKVIFGEIDVRDSELFVVLTYDREIGRKTLIDSPQGELNISEEVVFVAIKNGGHVTRGYAHFSKGLRDFAPEQESHVSKLFGSIMNYYGVSDGSVS